jgi:antitoxin component YwqK of YwqJK toxin-antitoxin module
MAQSKKSYYSCGLLHNSCLINKKGLFSGTRKFYDIKGNITTTIEYKNGKIEGNTKYFCPPVNMISLEYTKRVVLPREGFKSRKKILRRNISYTNKIVLQGDLSNIGNSRNGPFMLFYPNGIASYLGLFSYGKKICDSTYFYEDGKVERHNRIKRSRRVK